MLDVTDLVMIDPVGTGFSKPLGEAKGADFWGVDQDIKSVGAFIKRCVTENGRWASPKYILGESYGGMRSGGPRVPPADRHGMNLNGVVLVSPFLNCLGHRRHGDRPAARALRADARGHRLVPRRIAEQARLARGVHGRGRALRVRRVPAPALSQRLRDATPEERAVTARPRALYRPPCRLLGEGRPARDPHAVPAGAEARPAPDCRPHRLAFRRPGHEPARRAHELRPVLPRRRARCRPPSSTTCTTSSSSGATRNTGSRPST